MRSWESQSQPELQQQCGFHVMELYKGRTAFQCKGSGYWRACGRVQGSWQAVWTEQSALWTVLHSHCVCRGHDVQEQTEWECDDQNRYALRLLNRFIAVVLFWQEHQLPSDFETVIESLELCINLRYIKFKFYLFLKRWCQFIILKEFFFSCRRGNYTFTYWSLY